MKENYDSIMHDENHNFAHQPKIQYNEICKCNVSHVMIFTEYLHVFAHEQ